MHIDQVFPSAHLKPADIPEGREATVMQNTIYSEEMARAKTPGIYNANGLWQIGPMLIRWGTDEQKDRWIPNILNAEDHWCQGFSEPGARDGLPAANDRDRRCVRRWQASRTLAPHVCDLPCPSSRRERRRPSLPRFALPAQS